MDFLGCPKNVHSVNGFFRQRMGLTWQRSASCYSHWASMWHESQYNHTQHHHHTHEANILALVYAGWHSAGNLSVYDAGAQSQWAVTPAMFEASHSHTSPQQQFPWNLLGKLQKGFAQASHEQHIATESKQHQLKQTGNVHWSRNFPTLPLGRCLCRHSRRMPLLVPAENLHPICKRAAGNTTRF